MSDGHVDVRFTSVRRLLARMARSSRLLPRVNGRPLELSQISAPQDGTSASPDLVRLLVRVSSSLLEGRHDGVLDAVAPRMRSAQQRAWWDAWPGEHYRLLAALVDVLAAEAVVEIGTFTGMGTLAMLAGGATSVTTYDLVEWDAFPDSVLRPSDLAGAVQQRLVDLADPDTFERELPILEAADLVLVDGPKDWVFEPGFFALLEQHRERLRRPLFVIDDIRTLPLARAWLGLPFPKLDATSLGHWSGTGLMRVADCGDGRVDGGDRG